MIHVIGDSHACIFSGQEGYPLWSDADRLEKDILPYFRSYRLGPATAYQFERKLQQIYKILSSYVRFGDVVMPCVGEVDCRAHLIKQAELQNKPVNEIVDECVTRYFSAILQMREFVNPLNATLAVWGPIASFSDSITYDGPFQGRCIDRNLVTERFNNQLAALCSEAKIPFGSIFKDMIDENKLTDPSFVTSGIHLSKKGIPFILQECKRMGLIAP